MDSWNYIPDIQADFKTSIIKTIHLLRRSRRLIMVDFVMDSDDGLFSNQKSERYLCYYHYFIAWIWIPQISEQESLIIKGNADLTV